MVSALVVHVVAVSLWTGGLLGLVLHVRSEAVLLPGAVARFSPLALGAYLALAGSGLIAVAERLGTSGGAWTSGYGALVAAKVTALAGAGAARTPPPPYDDREPRPRRATAARSSGWPVSSSC